MLQCDAVCCSVFQCVAVQCNVSYRVMPCVAMCYGAHKISPACACAFVCVCDAVCCSVLQHVAERCRVLRCSRNFLLVRVCVCVCVEVYCMCGSAVQCVLKCVAVCVVACSSVL